MAATDTLTDKAIRAALKAAAVEGKSRKINDGGGLILEARPTGAGWWRLRYWRDSNSLVDGRKAGDAAGRYQCAGLATSIRRCGKERRVFRLRATWNVEGVAQVKVL